MNPLPKAENERKVERRRHPRAEATRRYRRLRSEIGRPGPLFKLADVLASRIGRTVRRTSVRIAGLRILLAAMRGPGKPGRFGPQR